MRPHARCYELSLCLPRYLAAQKRRELGVNTEIRPALRDFCPLWMGRRAKDLGAVNIDLEAAPRQSAEGAPHLPFAKVVKTQSCPFGGA